MEPSTQHQRQHPVAGGNRNAPSLPDVLREMSVQAADTLYKNLRITRALVAARLSCRALRDTLDGSVQSNFKSITEQDVENWRPGQAPVLARWPRCTKVKLGAQGLHELSSSDAHLALALPFAGLSAERYRGITDLEIFDDISFHEEEHHWYAESAIASVVAKLPMLRRLDLSGAGGMSRDPRHELLLCDALAALPHLEFLGLRDCSNLMGACQAVGDRLKELLIQSVVCGVDVVLDNVPAALCQLRAVERITVDSWGIDETPDFNSCTVAVRLLGCLPPSVQTFCMPGFYLPSGHESDIEFQLQQGRLCSVHATFLFCHRDLAALVREVLLPCLPAGYQLERLAVGFLVVPSDVRSSAAEVVCQLAARCKRVEVETLSLSLSGAAGDTRHVAQIDEATQIVKVLSGPAKLITYLYLGDGMSFEFCLELGGITPAGANTTAEAGAAGLKGGDRGGGILAQQLPPPPLLSGTGLAHAGMAEAAATTEPAVAAARVPGPSGDGSGTPAAMAVTAAAGQEVGFGGTAEPHRQQHAQPLPVPSGPQLVESALQRMVDAATAAAAATDTLTAGTAATSAAGASAECRHAGRLLLLRGPCVAMMVKAPEQLFDNWLVWLGKRAATCLPAGGVDPAGLRFLLVPAAGAVLVEVAGEEAAAAVVAAARSMEMEVAGASSVRRKAEMQECFLETLQQVTQEAWDGHIAQQHQQQQPGPSANRPKLPLELLQVLKLLRSLSTVRWQPWATEA